jgi:hypothetical protein
VSEGCREAVCVREIALVDMCPRGSRMPGRNKNLRLRGACYLAAVSGYEFIWTHIVNR